MQETKPDLPWVNEPMPCAPRDIRIIPWVFMGTFERMEREEAAARILSFSQQLDRWVGVSWQQLVLMMQADFANSVANYELRRQNEVAKETFRRLMQQRLVYSLLTLGLYAVFTKKPAVPRVVDVPPAPMSCVFLKGPEAVMEGLHELIDQGLIKYNREGDREDLDIFYPTRALVERIMQVQGIPAAA